MPITLEDYGLITQKYEEIYAEVVGRMKEIYGQNLVLDSTSPDRFVAEELTRLRLEVQELLLQIFNSFDPEQASGTQLDQRCAINMIKRKQGLKATAQIKFVTTAEITLDGLDTNPDTPFTLTDSLSRKWYLKETATIPASGGGTENTYTFEADSIGYREAAANTINQIDSPVAGLVSATNPAVVSDNGSDIETDAQLRLRRRKLLEPNFNSTTQRMRIAIAQLEGVKEVAIIENKENSTSVAGLPPHSYNVVVDGGDKQQILETINKYRPVGIQSYGEQSGTVTETDEDGTTYTFELAFDYAVAQDIGLVLTLGGGTEDTSLSDIEQYISEHFQPKINETVTLSEFIAIINAYDKSLYIIDDAENEHGLRLTSASSVQPMLSPTLARNRFVFNPSISNIVIQQG